MDFKKKFFDITNLIQQEFDRNLELYGEKIQCRKGCSKCCSQIFRITPLDGRIITEHVKSLPETERNRLIENAKEYIQQKPPSVSPPEGGRQDNNLHSETLLQACPALGTEGECTIYEARPVICRRFGMPIYDYKNPEKVLACELNFSDGDEITDPLLIPRQTEIGKKWDKLKEVYIAASVPRTDSTTIAVAIVEADKRQLV